MHVLPISYLLQSNQYKSKSNVFVQEKPLVYQSSENIIEKPSLDTLQAYSNVSFGYNCELKRLVKKGKIKLRFSFYGGKLNPKKVSIEHIILHPHKIINFSQNISNVFYVRYLVHFVVY